MADKTERREGFRTETASGLPDSIILTVGESFFAKNPNYNQGATLCLLWKGDVEEALSNGEAIDVDLDEFPVMFPCGEGWDSFDNGATAEHERGRKGFTDRSGAGMLIDRVVDKLGIEDELANRGDSMLEAKIWVGLKFLLEREEIDYGVNRQTGQPMKASRMLPTKFLGGGDVKVEASAEVEVAGGLLEGLDAKTLTKLKVAHKGAADSNAFAEKALAIDGIEANDALMTAIADDTLYELLK